MYLENKKKSSKGDGHHSTETEKNAAKEIIWWETDKIIWPWLTRYDPVYWHDMTLKLCQNWFEDIMQPEVEKEVKGERYWRRKSSHRKA